MTRVSWLVTAAILFGSDAAYAQQSCESLVNLKLPYTLIAAAASVAERAAPAPAPPGSPPASPGTVPAHCDVRGVIRPSGDSNIKFALWLPAASAWNANYRQEGNGGWPKRREARVQVPERKQETGEDKQPEHNFFDHTVIERYDE